MQLDPAIATYAGQSRSSDTPDWIVAYEVDHIVICGPQIDIERAFHAHGCPCGLNGPVDWDYAFALADSITTIATMSGPTARGYGLV